MHRIKAKGITEGVYFLKSSVKHVQREKSSKRGPPHNWQLVEIYRDSPLYFFSLTPCESGGEEAILRLVMSRHNILYTLLTHTVKYVHKSRHNDRLTRLPRKAGFDLYAGEKRSEGQGKNMEDAERRKSHEEHTGHSSFA